MDPQTKDKLDHEDPAMELRGIFTDCIVIPIRAYRREIYDI
jgi:hypothetical protein